MPDVAFKIRDGARSCDDAFSAQLGKHIDLEGKYVLYRYVIGGLLGVMTCQAYGT